MQLLVSCEHTSTQENTHTNGSWAEVEMRGNSGGSAAGVQGNRGTQLGVVVSRCQTLALRTQHCCRSSGTTAVWWRSQTTYITQGGKNGFNSCTIPLVSLTSFNFKSYRLNFNFTLIVMDKVPTNVNKWIKRFEHNWIITIWFEQSPSSRLWSSILG